MTEVLILYCMLGGGPEVRSAWMEFPVLLHEISMMKMEDGRNKGRKSKISKENTSLKKLHGFKFQIEF